MRLSAGVREHEIPTPALAELLRHHYGLQGATSTLLHPRAILAASPILTDPEDAARHYQDLAQNGHHIRLPDSLQQLLGERTRGLLIAVPKHAGDPAFGPPEPHSNCLEWMLGAKLLMDQVLGPAHAVAIGYPVAVEHAIVALTRANHAGSFIQSLPPEIERGNLNLRLMTRESDLPPTRIELRAEVSAGEQVLHTWAAPQLTDENHFEASFVLSLHARAHGLNQAGGQVHVYPGTIPLPAATEAAWAS